MDEVTLELYNFIEDNDVRFIRLQFTDLFGHNKNISVYVSEFERALKGELDFISDSVDGYSASGETELVLYPDPSTIMTLPWRPHQGRVARIICNVCYTDGLPYEGDSRQILSHLLNFLRTEENLEFQIGAKIEFYLFELDDNGTPTTKPVDTAAFFDLAPLDKGENTRREIILTLEEMGFSIISSHHEAGSGQNEIDFRMSDPLTCADNIQTFKTVVKAVAERNGLYASFMPKPLNNEPGSGMHIMISAYKHEENLFTEKNGKLSRFGEYFAGGILANLPEITLFANPLVNSYKRIASSFETEKEYKWEPDNKNALIRVPKNSRDEKLNLIIRTPDAAANPYLLFTLLIGAGLSGIYNRIEPSQVRVTLPASLLEAIKEADLNEVTRHFIDDNVVEEFKRQKELEWNDYITTVHDWEINKYFDNI